MRDEVRNVLEPDEVCKVRHDGLLNVAGGHEAIESCLGLRARQ